MPRTLTDDDLIKVLEEIITEGGNAAARIAAIRALREMEHREVPEGALAELYELTPRRGLRTKSA